jgi:hypothetical protein
MTVQHVSGRAPIMMSVVALLLVAKAVINSYHRQARPLQVVVLSAQSAFFG